MFRLGSSYLPSSCSVESFDFLKIRALNCIDKLKIVAFRLLNIRRPVV